jgi:hypothetical protein
MVSVKNRWLGSAMQASQSHQFTGQNLHKTVLAASLSRLARHSIQIFFLTFISSQSSSSILLCFKGQWQKSLAL